MNVVVTLCPELRDRGLVLRREFGLSHKQLVHRLIDDLRRGSVRREYVSVVQQEFNLRRLLAVRAMGQASSEELGELVRRLDRLKEISVELVPDLVLDRDPAIEQLLEDDTRHEWPALPTPPSPPRPGGRPKVGEGSDLSWLKLVIDITRIHDREKVSYAAAAARASISEKQFYKYRQTGRELGLLSADD
jgi:hypothetical protein